jgi:FkbM family methyltransferase
MSLRRLLERSLRDLAFPRRLPEDLGGGRVIVSPDAALRHLRSGLGTAERALLDQVRALVGEGDRVWDIGANLGVFGLAAAFRAGQSGEVLLVEADPWLFRLLQRSASSLAPARNARTTLACAAVGDRTGLARFNIAARGRASSALDGFGRSQAGGVRQPMLLGMVTLDDLLDATFRPDLVKLDIEGAELSALSAAPRLLEARPRFLVEVGGESRDALTDLLHRHDYRLLDAGSPLSGLRPAAAMRLGHTRRALRARGRPGTPILRAIVARPIERGVDRAGELC